LLKQRLFAPLRVTERIARLLRERFFSRCTPFRTTKKQNDKKAEILLFPVKFPRENFLIATRTGRAKTLPVKDT